MTKYGTCYFPTRGNAIRYYRPHAKLENAKPSELVDRKLAAGEIHIGKPPLKPGETLTIEDCRYHVTECPLFDSLKVGATFYVGTAWGDMRTWVNAVSRGALSVRQMCADGVDRPHTFTNQDAFAACFRGMISEGAK